MENDNSVSGNLNDNSVLDTLVLTREQRRSGIVKVVILILTAIIILFVPVTIRRSTDVTFGIIYKNIRAGLELAGLWMRGIIIMGNGLASVCGKYFCKNKDSATYRYHQGDSVLHPLFYLLGSIPALVLVLHYISPFFEGLAAIVSPDIGETVYSIATDAAWIIPVSAVSILLLLNYGIMDFTDSLMEPLVRPMFKIPGRNTVDVIASFVSSAPVGILATSELYQKGIYTKKEATLIATGFNVVGVGLAYKVIETANLSEYFLPIYFIALLMALIVSFFMARAPPLSRKAFVSADGRQQTKEEISAGRVPTRTVLKIGASRAVKKATATPNPLKEIWSNPLDSCYALPKVILLPTAMGIIAMLIATYTPVSNWTGKLFEPLLVLLQVSNAAEVAPSLPAGIAEMFSPVLVIADKVDAPAMGARYMTVIASMMQIISFSGTIVIMISTRIPVSPKELIVCSFERTAVAVPISALFMHPLF